MRTAALISTLLLVCVATASAGVVTHDTLAVKGEPVMLMAETKGRFFREGGRLVNFAVDGTTLGQSLSGGDGRAYREFRPQKTGLYTITVTSNGDEDTGYVLSVNRGSGVVFIDVVGSLIENPLTREPRQESRAALREIARAHPLVYLQTVGFGLSLLKAWLKENDFPSGPLLEWAGGRAFRETDGMGLKVHAVVGTPQVLESARKYGPLAFSFEEAEDARRVKDWQEVTDSLSEGE